MVEVGLGVASLICLCQAKEATGGSNSNLHMLEACGAEAQVHGNPVIILTGYRRILVQQ